MKRNIVVVDAVSTGYNYVEDIVRRGYSPVVLEPRKEDTTEMAALKEVYKQFYHQPVIISEADTYEETLELVRSCEPAAIVAGSEYGVILCTRLAEDLGLAGNPADHLDEMTLKNEMHEALRKAGLRYIRGKIVDNADDAILFCSENGFSTAVVKPLQSAGSQGLFLCDNLEEVRDAVSSLLTMNDIYGRPISSVLVQERIVGTEYIVNTVSSDGNHRLNSILRYRKEKTDEGGYIYDYTEFIGKLEAGHTKLVEYALKVADAIHFRYGIIHGEYMIDDDGPVLIEVNCRPMGASMPAEFLDLIQGQHETDSALDSILDHDKFMTDAAKPYMNLRKGYMKHVMIPEDIEAENHPIWEVARKLRSTFKISANETEKPVQYQKTRDLESSGGVIYMVHDDESVVESDLELIREIEAKYFKLLLNDGMSRRWFRAADEEEPDFRECMKKYGCHGAVLIASDLDQEIEGAQCVTSDTLDDAHKGFDYVVIGYQDTLLKLNESQCLKLIFSTMDLVREGGKVIIPETTYRYLSYEREGAEELMIIDGLTVEPPTSDTLDRIIGIRLKDEK